MQAKKKIAVQVETIVKYPAHLLKFQAPEAQAVIEGEHTKYCSHRSHLHTSLFLYS